MYDTTGLIEWACTGMYEQKVYVWLRFGMYWDSGKTLESDSESVLSLRVKSQDSSQDAP